MTAVYGTNDPHYYATNFANLDLTETRYLVFRDVPALIEKYVNGNLTLDYGCGPGSSIQHLRALGLNVEGVDINEEMIELARRQDPSGKYEVIKSGEIPRVNNYYDFVYSSFVLVHAETKVELHKIVKDIARVLKPGGTFIAIVSNDETYKYEWLSGYTNFEGNKELKSGSVTKFIYKNGNFVIYAVYWSEEDYREALLDAGLRVVRVHKPYGKITDGYNWINEMDRAFVTILVAQKLD